MRPAAAVAKARAGIFVPSPSQRARYTASGPPHSDLIARSPISFARWRGISPAALVSLRGI